MRSAELPPASLRLHIDLDALTSNWRAMDRLSGPASTGAAVKANAYGLGVDNVVPTLVKAGCKDFFVAHWCEVPDLLAQVPAGNIAVLHGISNAAEADFARQSGALPVINSIRQAAMWRDSGGGPCHLMVDTGINRLGISPAEVTASDIEALSIETLISHLASADEVSASNLRQLDLFRDLARHVPHRRLSLANSAGIALGEDYAFDLTRPGLALYGGIPRPELEGIIKQVAYPEAAVLQVRNLSAGDSVGYNGRFTATGPMKVATVSIGYADGFLRCRGPGFALQYGDAQLPVLGQVSMDMIVVDCTHATDLRAGDFLSVPFDLPAISASSGMSQYELLTTIGSRFAVNF